MSRPVTEEDLKAALKKFERRITISFAIMMTCFVVIISSLWIAKHGG